jgi:hypothetical protein
MKKVLLLLAIFLASLTACQPNGSNQNTSPKSTLKGQVFLAECQGAEIATDCFSQQPYQATLIIYDGQMKEIARIVTNTDGTFEYKLPAGVYFIHPDSPGRYPIANDYKVVLQEGKTIELTILYDSGVR